MADPVMIQPVQPEMVHPEMAQPEMVKRGWFHRARPVMIHIDDVPEYRVRGEMAISPGPAWHLVLATSCCKESGL